MGKGNKKKKTQNVQRPPMHIDEPKFELDVAPVQISDGDKKFKAQQERERREQEREIQLKKELIEQEKKKKNKAKPKQNSQKNKSQSKDNETKNQEELAVKTDFKRDTSTSRTENIRTNNTTERYQTNNNVNRPSYSNTKSFGRINYNYNKNDKDYEEFLHSKPIKDCKVIELKGDLFDAPEEYSLAHCVAEDFSMGAGIAKEFRARFKKVGKLLDQNQKTGGLAILEDKDRFIYYLVTKPVSRGKPTLYTLWKSVLKLQEHIIKHKVTKLAIPQIGCGLDRLDWNDVKQMLEFVFQKIDIEIAVYILDFTEETPNPSKVLRKSFVVHKVLPLIDIDSQTGLIYFGTEDGSVTHEMECLANKYNFIDNYQKQQKSIGDTIKIIEQQEYIYGLIIKKSKYDKISFEVLNRCLINLCAMLQKDKTQYIGIQGFIEKDDEVIMEKIVNLMQYTLRDVEIWICWPEELAEYCPQLKY